MVCFEQLPAPIAIASTTTTNDVRLEFEENMFGWGPQLKNVFEQ
jgi:hypothetical protein